MFLAADLKLIIAEYKTKILRISYHTGIID